MSIYRLDKLMKPASVALVGAGGRCGSLGRTVLLNLRRSGFPGPILLVNPKHASIDGETCYCDLHALPMVPDVVIVASPPATVPEIVDAAGQLGVAGAVIITAGLGRDPGSFGDRTRVIARQYGLRLLGPNCLGLMLPNQRLNASFAASAAMPGDLALVSQSGAVAAGMVEWAARRRIGFSAVVSLGDACDVDFGDCLDHFAADRATRAILLYVESIGDARKFMSAARAAARSKPVIVVKSGRFAQGARAAATHTGALAGSDAVYAAAFRRAGLVRVLDLEDLFAAAEMLGRAMPFAGERLAILTNGGGLGVMAVDEMSALSGQLATLPEATLERLDACLPPTWSRANPVDIVGDAGPTRFAQALDILLADEATDAVMVIQVQTGLTGAADEAVADCIDRARLAGNRKPVFAVWLGNEPYAAHFFDPAGIPHFGNEADATNAFMHLVEHHRAQKRLAERPDPLPAEFVPDIAAARGIVAQALADGRSWLTPVEANRLLEAYDIPVEPLVITDGPEAAALAARRWLSAGQAVAIKIHSADIVHKSDVGGVALDLTSEAAVTAAARTILDRARDMRPDARIDGIAVQPMVRRRHARELIAGLAEDPTFGPVVVFGMGGTAVEVVDDKAIALPPLDMRSAQDLIDQTRVARLLDTYRNVPAADKTAIALTLVKLAQLAADIPEIRGLDINPLLADAAGVITVDARVTVASAEGQHGSVNSRFALRPYPRQWERELATRSGRRYLVRPVRADDEGLLLAFFKRMSPDDLRLRFFGGGQTYDHPFVSRLVQLDYAREMAFVALEIPGGELAGIVRLHADPDHETAEYAVMVRSDLKGSGLGWSLMQQMIDWARAEGIKRVHGPVLRENTVMLAMCRQLGFTARARADEPAVMDVDLRLSQPSEAEPAMA